MVLALVARIKFFLLVKRLALRAGQWQGGESKHPSLPLARAERKLLDRKKKLNPRHQREKDFWFSFGTQKRT